MIPKVIRSSFATRLSALDRYRPIATRLSTLVGYWPFAALAAMLAWAWRGADFFRTIPSYQDTLETMWALSWYGEALPAGKSIDVYPLLFYPVGWHYGENFYLTLSLLPLYWLGGPAFTYNLMELLTFVIAFAGTFMLSRRFLSTTLAGVAALLVAFSGARWSHMIGHLNILVGSALLPWILWSIDRALHSPNRSLRWFVLAGVLWAGSMSGSMYFAFLSGAGVLAWVGGCLIARTINWRTAVLAVLVPSAIALLLSAPAIYRLYQVTIAQGAAYHSILEVNFWGASLNSLALPSLDSKWLGSMARQIYQGLPYEQGSTNLGLVASVLALIGFWAARRRRAWRPVQVVAAVGVVLALGLTLKWDNGSIALPWLRPVSTVLWRLGHLLKPRFFAEPMPPAPFDTAIPAPGILLFMVVPFLEHASVFARFALVGSIGVAMLAGLTLSMVRNRWLRLGLVLLLLVELVPNSLPPLPFAGVTHPAFEWLSKQDLAGGSIVDLVAAHEYTPVLLVDGESAWATRLHHQPAVAGASNVWPQHSAFLNSWLVTHEHAFWDSKLVPILRFYNIRYVLLHVRGAWERRLVTEARQNPELNFVKCFDRPSTRGPWFYPICILQVLPAANQQFNLVLENGWSKQEDWGVWAESTRSDAFWVATLQARQALDFQVFPNCSHDRSQKLSVTVNDVVVGTHDWQDCEPWKAHIELPASLVRQGRNNLVLQAGYAIPPVDLKSGKALDTRPLSVGFTQLRVSTQ